MACKNVSIIGLQVYPSESLYIVTDQQSKNTSISQKVLFNCAGFFFVVLGVIGAFLPVMPTTPFLILAAACFSKGSERYHQWLCNHRWFGPIIKDWENKRCMQCSIKIYSISTMLVSASLSIIVLPNIYGQIACCILVGIGCYYVYRIPVCAKNNL